MLSHKPTILFICTDWYEFGGSSASLIDMIQALGDRITPIVLLNAEGCVADKMRQMGLRILVHPFFYLWDKPKPLKTTLHHPTRSTLYRHLTLNRRCANMVISSLQGTTIDIVHSNSSITTVGATLAKKLRAKHIWHIREFIDLDFRLDVYGGRKQLQRTIERHSDARICVSSAVAHHWHLQSEGTHVLWDAVVNTSHGTPTILDKEPYFLFCAANITASKGAEETVEAFCLSNLADKGYRLKMAGHITDEYRQHLLTLAKKTQDDTHIEFCGFCKPEEIFPHATAFIMSSPCEAMGRVTVQAMWYGCPVVARNSGGTPDFVRHNETGYLYEAPSECAQWIRQVAFHPTLDIIHKAQNFIAAHFSIADYGDKIMNIYNSLL